MKNFNKVDMQIQSLDSLLNNNYHRWENRSPQNKCSYLALPDTVDCCKTFHSSESQFCSWSASKLCPVGTSRHILQKQDVLLMNCTMGCHSALWSGLGRTPVSRHNPRFHRTIEFSWNLLRTRRWPWHTSSPEPDIQPFDYNNATSETSNLRSEWWWLLECGWTVTSRGEIRLASDLRTTLEWL